MPGPLASLKVVEFAGLGPAPLAAQLLADLGADVVCIDRASRPADPADINRRGKRSVALNLKHPDGLSAAHRLIAQADILIEGYRPGVMEKLGLGPADCPERLIYGRMTGWGQDGPLAQMAGHDINYLALTGVLNALGPADGPPMAPLNLAADYGGGTMFLLLGLLSAIIERGVSGKGQVVDAAMIDGVPAMMGLILGMRARGDWADKRQSNLLDGGAPFYRTYSCADGGAIAVGPLEPQFFAELVEKAGLDPEILKSQSDKDGWPAAHAAYEKVFARRGRDEWAQIFEGSDACVAPVLSFEEAEAHPHNAARGLYYRDGEVLQAAPAPRFSRSAAPRPASPTGPGSDSAAVLAELDYSPAEIEQMRKAGVLT